MTSGVAGPEGIDVALLTPCYWPEVRRGGERFVHELAVGLRARGHAPRIVTAHPGPTLRTVEAGVPIVRFRRPSEAYLRRRWFEAYLTHAPRTYLELRSDPPQVAHAIYVTDAAVAARRTAAGGAPTVFSCLGLPTRGMLLEARGRLELYEYATARASATVSLSERTAQELRRWLGVDTRVIHPGVDLATFTIGAERAEAPTVLCPSDIAEPRKRVGMLVAACRRLRRELPELRLVLSRSANGSPPAAPGLDEPWIELRDLDDPAALTRAYQEAWATALPSFDEGFGLVLVESLACGTPAVGADDGGAVEIVDGSGVGSVFEVESEDALVLAVRDSLELAGDPATRSRCRARAEQFGLDACTDAYVRLYRELMAG